MISINRLGQLASAQRAAILLSGVVLSIILGLSVCVVWDAHQDVRAQADRTVQNLAHALEQDIAHNIDLYDLTIQATKAGLGLPGIQDASPEVRHAALFSRMNKAHYTVSCLVLDERGEINLDSESAVPRRANFADRDYFQVHRSRADVGLYASRPLRSRLTGMAVMVFSRRLEHLDGSFAGVALATVQLAYFQDLFARFDLGTQGAVTLFRNDGVLLARGPADETQVGRDMSEAPVFKEAKTAGSGIFQAHSKYDGVMRLYGFRQIASSPLVVAVGLGVDDVFAAWRHKAAVVPAVIVVLLGLAFLLMATLRRERQRRSKAEQDARQSAQGLAEALGRLDALFVNSADALFVARRRTDGQFAFEAVNPKVEELTGLLMDAMIGHAPETCMNAEAGRSVQAQWQQSVQQRRALRYSQFLDMSVGRRTWETILVPVFDGAGEVCQLVGTARDVTERNRTEDMLKQLNETLEARVAEAVAAKQEALVRAAQSERIQALGQLSGGIAHDFNNVLQAISGFAALMERRAADAAGTRRLARLTIDAAARGTSVTRRLLAFCRRDELEAQPVDAASLLASLHEILVHTLGSAIEVRINAANGMPCLLADKGQLETVLLNLATNARDAMPAGGVLTLGVAEEEVHGSCYPAGPASGHYIRFDVADTGTGMDSATMARVTEPFFTTKSVGKGTGLGLSMAHGFAEQSGGKLAIKSAPGQGTIISLWLPKAQQAEEHATPKTSLMAHGSDPIPSLRRVLVVDDDPYVREAVAEQLAETYGVLVAADGNEAQALLMAGEVVDILVTDLSMPGMDGLTLIREAQMQLPGLPAVLLTGYADESASLALNGILTSAFSLLRKPATAAQLNDRIAALLAQPKSRTRGVSSHNMRNLAAQVSGSAHS
ncbi:MAG: ATP-binding protein [Janthinobacterium lividum]